MCAHILFWTHSLVGAAPTGVYLGEVGLMNETIEQRACDLAVYVIEHQATVRAAAAAFGVSKSTVHKDLSERLRGCNLALYRQVQVVLAHNKAERHIRGGLATQKKYRKEKI